MHVGRQTSPLSSTDPHTLVPSIACGDPSSLSVLV